MTNKSLYFYGLLALPLSFAGLPLYLHIPDLYATQFGLPLATIGIILLFIRLFDAVQDPVIGVIMRNLQSNRAKLKSLVWIVAVLLIAAIYLLLKPQDFMPVVVWFALLMLVCTTAFSLLTIIYQSIGAIWKEGYLERSKITAMREGMGLFGVTIAAILPTILMEFFTVQKSFEIFAIIFAGLTLIVVIFWLRWLDNVKFKALDSDDHKPASPLSFLKIKSIRPLFAVWFFSQLSSAIPVILFLAFVRDALNLESMTGMFLLIYFLSGILGMPLWQRVQKFLGKQKTWQTAMFLAVISFVWAYTLGEGDAVGFGIVCIFSGIALGAELAIPPSILADRISSEKAENSTTQFFGASTFLGKMALAIASGIVLPLIAYLGYSADEQNSESAIDALILAYALIPCFIKLAAALSLNYIKLEGENNELTKQNKRSS